MTKSKSQKVAAKALKTSEEKEHNPFERRKNEPHFKIFGRRTQQTEQKVGQSRARAMEKVQQKPKSNDDLIQCTAKENAFNCYETRIKSQ